LKKIEDEKFLVEIEKVIISGENLSKMSVSGKVFGKRELEFSKKNFFKKLKELPIRVCQNFLSAIIWTFVV
jgi:hypothetical protein